ncbi:7686_t:CDS:2 [Ambispora gerdemannii]|uniref:7686_t:CDS:1 n=1 Tax=Ambispora gerdemannii TaxID=144530 RepID=A0A9N9GAI4_9GLOM|nr:7686_t:CDS:2 [Ambispora gerdemannii]
MSSALSNSSYMSSLTKNPLTSALLSLAPFFGSLAKHILFVLILLNVKSLPTVYHWRCWFLFQKIIWRRKRELRERKEGKIEKKTNSQELFRVFRQEHRLWPDDLDLNIHMNNSSYLKVLDFLRIEQIFTLFGDLLIPKELYLANGGCKIVYKKEIPPFAKYTVESCVLTWNDKWVFILSRFLLPSKAKTSADKDPIVATIVVNKLVFKEPNGKTAEPAAVFERLGFFKGESEEERNEREAARKKLWTFVESGVDKLFEENGIWKRVT